MAEMFSRWESGEEDEDEEGSGYAQEIIESMERSKRFREEVLRARREGVAGGGLGGCSFTCLMRRAKSQTNLTATTAFTVWSHIGRHELARLKRMADTLEKRGRIDMSKVWENVTFIVGNVMGYSMVADTLRLINEDSREAAIQLATELLALYRRGDGQGDPKEARRSSVSVEEYETRDRFLNDGERIDVEPPIVMVAEENRKSYVGTVLRTPLRNSLRKAVRQAGTHSTRKSDTRKPDPLPDPAEKSSLAILRKRIGKLELDRSSTKDFKPKIKKKPEAFSDHKLGNAGDVSSSSVTSEPTRDVGFYPVLQFDGPTVTLIEATTVRCDFGYSSESGIESRVETSESCVLSEPDVSAQGGDAIGTSDRDRVIPEDDKAEKPSERPVGSTEVGINRNVSSPGVDAAGKGRTGRVAVRRSAACTSTKLRTGVSRTTVSDRKKSDTRTPVEDTRATGTKRATAKSKRQKNRNNDEGGMPAEEKGEKKKSMNGDSSEGVRKAEGAAASGDAGTGGSSFDSMVVNTSSESVCCPLGVADAAGDVAVPTEDLTPGYRPPTPKQDSVRVPRAPVEEDDQTTLEQWTSLTSLHDYRHFSSEFKLGILRADECLRREKKQFIIFTILSSFLLCILFLHQIQFWKAFYITDLIRKYLDRRPF